MATITLEYTIPRDLQPLSIQSAALLGVVLQSPTLNNELTMLGQIAESAPRVVTAIGVPPTSLKLTLTYASTPAFLAYFPTTATQIQAVTKFWSQRISLKLRTRVTASTPVITP